MNLKKIVASTLFLTLTFGFFCLSAGGGIITVSPNNPAIQSAIDSAFPNDEIVLSIGTYTDQDIDFKGKTITVRSTNPNDPSVVANTVINCQASGTNLHRGFYFHSGEGLGSILSGVKIINGYHTSGGAVYCDNASSPTISNCIIDNNTAKIYGGGIYCKAGSNPLIIKCVISNNSNKINPGVGGGIACQASSPIISNCTFFKNSAQFGGGIFMYNVCNPVITNCTFSGNTAVNYGGGIYAKTNCAVTITNSVLWGDNIIPTDNTTIPDSIGPEIGMNDNSGVTVSYSDVQGGEGLVYVTSSTKTWSLGNIQTDPNFVSVADLHLTVGSPCIDAGDPNVINNGQTDIDGDPRVIQDRVDMGSDEVLFVGTLSVDTTPVKGEIFVDGQTWGTGLISKVIPAGTHTVSFGAMTGYTKPADKKVLVSANQTTMVLEPYVLQTGTLTVITTPVDSEVIVDNVSWGTAPQSRTVPVGSHTVSFGAIAGYGTPVDQQANIQDNQTTTITGPYLRSSPAKVHLIVNTEGSGTVLPVTGDFNLDTVVSLSASAADGWTFDHWEGAVTGTTAKVDLKMDGSKTVTAVFLASNSKPTDNQTSDNLTLDGNLTNPWRGLCPCLGLIVLAGLFAGAGLLGRN